MAKVLKARCMMKIERSNPSGVHSPGGAYTHAITVSDARLLFIAGQVALDENREIVGKEDLGAQAEQAMKNIKAILDAHGADFTNVVKTQIFIVDYSLEKRAALVDVLGRYFGDIRPTSTLLGIQALATPGLMIEIEAVAALPLE